MYKKIITILFLFVIHTAFAQKTMTVEEAIKIGLAQNLSLKTNDAAINKAQQKVKLGAELPKTGIFIENEDLQPINTQGILKIGLSQNIDFPTVYGAKRSLYKQQSDLASLQKNLSETELKRDIRAAYYGLWFAQNKVELAVKLDSLYSVFAAATDLRVKTGEATGLERLAANAQKEQARATVLQAQQTLILQTQILQMLLNTTETPKANAGNLEKINPPLTANSEPILLQIQQKNINIAEAEKYMQQQQNLPDFSGRTFSQHLYGYSDSPYTGFSVTMNLPLLSKPLQKTKLATLEIELQKAQLSAETQSLNSLQAQAKTTMQRAQAALQYYETTGLAQADALIKATTLAYRSGEISYAALSQYLAQAIAIRQNYLDNLNEYNQAVIAYLYFINA
jgi:heavy metal efflux system protein